MTLPEIHFNIQIRESFLRLWHPVSNFFQQPKQKQPFVFLRKWAINIFCLSGLPL